VRLLQQRFGPVPAAVLQTIEATNDSNRLDGWLDRFATARSLREIAIK
jgi:hypothetical protein